MTRKTLVTMLALALALVPAAILTAGDSPVGTGNLLISVEEAAELQGTDNVVFVDVRQADDFEAGHIPGARQVWRPDYGADSGEYEYRGMRADAEKFHELLGNLGIEAETHVVVYTHGNNHDSFRFTWLLEQYGHASENTSIINGQFPAWERAGYDIATGAQEPVTAVTYEPVQAIDESRVATLDDVRRGIDDDNVVVLDTRTGLEHWGIALYDGAFRRGHIPTSVHVNYVENFTEDGVLDVEALREMYEEAGVTQDKEIIAWCQSGVRSSMTTMLLGDVLGYEIVANYDGSWIEYSYHRDEPVTAYFLYIISALFVAAIIGLGVWHALRVRAGQPSVLIKVDIAVAIAFVVFLGWYFNLFSLISMDRIGELQMWIEGMGAAAPLVFMGLFTVGTIVFLPGLPFAIVAGVVFGPIWGTVYASIGSTIGAALAMLAGRYLFRRYTEGLADKYPKVKKIDDGVAKHGWRMLMITRFIPIVPFNVQNYVYGLTKIPFWTYALLSWLFMLPGTAAYVFISGAAVSGAEPGEIMVYFAIGAVLLVGMSLVPSLLKKKSSAAEVLG